VGAILPRSLLFSLKGRGRVPAGLQPPGLPERLQKGLATDITSSEWIALPGIVAHLHGHPAYTLIYQAHIEALDVYVSGYQHID
jgi:hypothetical protein